MPNEGQRSLVTLAAAILTIVVVAILYWARSLLIPIALAIFLTFVLSPLVAWVQHRGLGRTFSVILVIVLVLLISASIGGVIANEFVKIAETLPDRKEAIEAKIISAKNWLSGNGESRFGQMIDDLKAVILPKPSADRTVVVEPASPPLTSQLQPYISPSIEVLGQAALTLVLTIYMLIRREDLRNRMIRLLGDGRVTTTTKAVDEASRRISHYLLMQLLINAAFGLILSLGLLILGVKYVVLWGFIAAVMRYVPYIGSWVGLIPPVLFSFATSSAGAAAWGQPLGVLLFYICLELVCANVVEPWLYGSSMGLSAVAQLIATAFWAYLWGPIGLILASPLTACLLVLGKHVRGADFLEVILGDQPALAPCIAFYQRLAAQDQDEASEVAQTEAKATCPEATLENVVIPALSLARRDRDRGDLDQAAFRFAIHAAKEVATELEEMCAVDSGEQGDERVRLLVCPARDEAENVAAEILAGILDPKKWEVRIAGDELLASELIASIEEFRPAVLVLIALPPGGLSHCRYLMNRVRSKFSGVRVIVGRWDTAEQTPADAVFNLRGVDAVDRSLGETRKRLISLHPVLVAENEKLNANGKPEPRGIDRQKAMSAKPSSEEKAHDFSEKSGK